jgi:hypothetical protein
MAGLRFGLQGRVGGVALLMSATRKASRPRQAWRPSSRDTAMTGFKVRSAELSDLRSDCLLVSSIKKPLFFAVWLARITSTPRHRLRDLDPAELLLRDFPDSLRRTCTALELLVITCGYNELGVALPPDRRTRIRRRGPPTKEIPQSRDGRPE